MQSLNLEEERFKNSGDEVHYAVERTRCLIRLGRLEEARTFAAEAVENNSISGKPPNHEIALLWAYTGELVKAEEILKQLDIPDSISTCLDHAPLHAILGHDEHAIQLCDEAAELGFRFTPYAGWEPEYDHLMDDPRFKAVLAKINGQ